MKVNGKEEITIYTVKFDSAAWVLDVINNTFYLFNENKNYKINIKILNDFNDNIFKNYLKYYIHLTFNFILRKKIKYNFKRFDFLNLPFNKDSIYYQILLNKKINFVFKNYKFEISKFKFSILDLIYFQVKSSLLSLLIFINYYFFKKKIDFLKLKITNILVGPLIASTLLRETPKMGGKFSFNSKLFLILKEAVFNILISKDNFTSNRKKNNYVIVPEPTYIQVLWKRILLKKGFQSIETHHYKRFPIINKDYYNFFPWMAEKRNIQQIKNPQKNKISNYFKKRFFNPHLVISYMVKDNSNDNLNKSVLNFKKEKIFLDNKEIIAVVFLHSFDDAQYIFKYDGFEDLYQWTVFTIDRCLENKNISKILVKPHPGLDFERYPGDRVAFDNISKRYYQNLKVEILKKDTSIINLFNNHRYAIGLTHHSSATEELIFLKKKVIGFLYGVWGTNYKFMETWKNKKDLRKIIKRIKKNKFLPPTKKEYNIFLNYILERKININLRFNLSVRVLLANSKSKYFKWGKKGEHSGHLRYMNDIKNFQIDQKFLNDIIKPIYQINKYKYK